MSNAYVLGGYLAVVAIFGVYVWHLRRRARILARNLPAPPSSPRPDSERGAGS
jgi:hypothetical protein